MKTNNDEQGYQEPWWANEYNIGQILIALLIFCVIAMLFQFFFETDLETTAWFSVTIWALLYFGYFFKLSWIKVSPNTGVILHNPFKPLQSPTDIEKARKETSQYTVLRNQRGVGSGWQGKSWLEQPFGEPIPIVKTPPISFTVFTFDKNDAPWEVPITFTMTPLTGRFLPRSRISNSDAAREAFQKIIGRKTQKEIRSRNENEILKEADDIRNNISNILGGPGAYADEEIDQGYYTGMIEVGPVQPSATIRKALESKEESRLQTAGIIALKEVLKTKEGRHAADVFIALNSENARVLVIRGLDDSGAGIEPHMKAELIGAAFEGMKAVKK